MQTKKFISFLYLKKTLLCFLSFTLTILSYCTIWSATYKTYLEPLRKLQNKAMRVINNMQWSSNSDPLFRKNKILKLDDLTYINPRVELKN